MVTYDARPSGFNQLTTTGDWELFMRAAGIWDGVEGQSSFAPTISGMNVTMSAGTVLIKGQLWNADAPVTIAVPAAASQARIDVLVIRLNRGAANSAGVVQPVIITGTPGASPVAPPIQQTTAGFWDVPIAQWTTNANSTTSGLIDIRRYSGRSVIDMISTQRPTPVNPRLGLEIDTGNLMRWNGSAWVPVIPAAQPQAQMWHWTHGGGTPTTATTVITNSTQNVTIANQATLLVQAISDVAMPSLVNLTYLQFAQLNGVNIEGNSFAILEAPNVRMSLSRMWVTGVLAPGTYSVRLTHNVNTVSQAVQNRGGDVTVLAIPS
jgi:hypothetical protein